MAARSFPFSLNSPKDILNLVEMKKSGFVIDRFQELLRLLVGQCLRFMWIVVCELDRVPACRALQVSGDREKGIVNFEA
jgi:hypothetical protein